METYPHKNNFCAGAYKDWLEVNLLPECNASCSWCIEKNGYKPTKRVGGRALLNSIMSHGAENIMLLGGEPTMYKDLRPLIRELSTRGKRVWLTTNGSLLTKEFVKIQLEGIYGINVSIHHYFQESNREITGLNLSYRTLHGAVQELRSKGITVRLNCNCISGYIDLGFEILRYINFAKMLGVSGVRFAELKQDNENFVDLAEIWGLNNDPFQHGCAIDEVVDGVNVNFRLMCGLQTDKREKPVNPQQVQKQVLYYDGILYDGWQTTKEVETVTDKELVNLMFDVESGKVSPMEAAVKITKELKHEKPKMTVTPVATSSGCTY